MKTIYLSAILLVLTLFSSCSDFIKDPAVYNDEVIDIYNSIVNDYDAYEVYYIETSWDFADKIEEKRLSTIQLIKSKIVELEMVGAYRDNSTLIDMAIASSKRFVVLLETDDKKLNELYDAYYNEELSEEEYNTLSSKIIDAGNIEISDISDTFEITQEAFAKKYNYEIEEIIE